MVCSDSKTILVSGSWANVAPETITVDIHVSSKDEAIRSRVDHFVDGLGELLKANESVMTVTQDTWSPQRSWLNIK